MHPGPLVAVSSKEDLAELVRMRRTTGTTGVIDLRPEKTLVWPHGVRPTISRWESLIAARAALRSSSS